MTSAWLDFLGFSDKDASQHLHSGCILYIFMYTAEREGRGGGFRGCFLKEEKFVTHPHIKQNFFIPPPHSWPKKKMTTPPVLLRKVKYGQYYKMMQRLIENKIKR